MAIEVQNCIPESFIVGDTVKFRMSFAYFPATGGWGLQFIFGGQAITAATDGSDFIVTIPATTSALIVPGSYQYAAKVSLSGEVFTPQIGTIRVLPSPAVNSAQSWARQTLTAVENAIKRLSTGTNDRVNINGQEFWKKDLTKLMDFRDRLKAEVAKEDEAAGLKSNLSAKKLRTRFI